MHSFNTYVSVQSLHVKYIWLSCEIVYPNENNTLGQLVVSLLSGQWT